MKGDHPGKRMPAGPRWLRNCKAKVPNFTLFSKALQALQGLLNRGVSLTRPMNLQEIDTVDAKPLKACFRVCYPFGPQIAVRMLAFTTQTNADLCGNYGVCPI